MVGIDSIATAGDVNRNVLCTSNPVEVHQQAHAWAVAIGEHLLPKTKAYAEIWLDEKIESTEDEQDFWEQITFPENLKPLLYHHKMMLMCMLMILILWRLPKITNCRF